MERGVIQTDSRRRAIFAIALLVLAVGILIWSLASGSDPTVPTAKAPPGANPVYRASGEPLSGEGSALPPISQKK